MKTDLDGDLDGHRLIAFSGRIEVLLFHRFDSGLVDVFVERFDHVNVFRIASGTRGAE